MRGSDAWELLPVSGYHGEDPRLAGVVLCCRLVGGVPTLFVCLTLECFPLVGTDARFLYTKDRVRFPNLKGSPEARATSDVDGNDCKSMGWAWIGPYALLNKFGEVEFGVSRGGLPGDGELLLVVLPNSVPGSDLAWGWLLLASATWFVPRLAKGGESPTFGASRLTRTFCPGGIEQSCGPLCCSPSHCHGTS